MGRLVVTAIAFALVVTACGGAASEQRSSSISPAQTATSEEPSVPATTEMDAWCEAPENHGQIYNAAYDLGFEDNPVVSAYYDDDGVILYEAPEGAITLQLGNSIFADPMFDPLDYVVACKEAWNQRDTAIYAGQLRVPVGQGFPVVRTRPVPTGGEINDPIALQYVEWALETLSGTTFADSSPRGLVGLADAACDGFRQGDGTDVVADRLMNVAMLDAISISEGSAFVFVVLIGGVDSRCPEFSPSVDAWLEERLE